METVEEFIDRCLSLENLIDHARRRSSRGSAGPERAEDEDEVAARQVDGLQGQRSTWTTTSTRPSSSRRSRRSVEDEKREAQEVPRAAGARRAAFLLEHAPLEHWQRDVLAIIRDEAYYFAPQAQTKIMNEGWASYWHSTIMTEQGAATTRRSSTTPTTTPARWRPRPGQLNPYKLGIELFRDIEDRWNKGQFGKEWDECDDLRRASATGTSSSAWAARRSSRCASIYNDVTFIDEFLTPEFCDRAEALHLRLQRAARAAARS